MSAPHVLAAALLTEQATVPDVDARRHPVPAPEAPPAIGAPISVGRGTTGVRLDLAQVLRRRRSIRWFGPAPVDAGTLADVVDSGLTHWPLADPAELTVVAFRLAGLPPAVYRYDSGARVMTPVMNLPEGEQRASLTMQPEFSDAAAIISLGIPLQRMTGTAHDYRRAMTAVGSAAYAMWLDGIARGLVGSVFAGFLPAAIRRPLRSDGANRHQAFALALGSPVGVPGDENGKED